MNKKMFLAVLLYAFPQASFSQSNVGVGTNAPEGKLHVKSTENISQLVIESQNNSNTNPMFKIRVGNEDMVWLHSDVTTNLFFGVGSGRVNNQFQGAINNTFMGYNSGYYNTLGFNNTTVGPYALYNNTEGSYNSAVGPQALRVNTTGDFNTALGADALRTNTTASNNTALGSQTLNWNTTGGANTAAGYRALYSNTIGDRNVAVGHAAFNANTGGSENTAVGTLSLRMTTASSANTAIGANAGDGFDNGWNNVFVGANTDVNGAGYFNSIAIGQGTIATGSNVARFGNAFTSSYGGWAGWSNVSDGRFKTNVQQDVPGLSFITQLKPVTYHLKVADLDAFLHRNNKEETGATAQAMYAKAVQEKEAITYTGFIAQDVEAAAQKLGFDFSGVDKPKNENDTYGLRYAEFVVPLVKAVQEQQDMIKALQDQNDLLKKEMAALKEMINAKK